MVPWGGAVSYERGIPVNMRSNVKRKMHGLKSQVQNRDLESVSPSVGTSLCPYGIAYRMAYGFFLVTFSLGSGLFPIAISGDCIFEFIFHERI